MSDTKFIDITPEVLKTPEGRARVAQAQDAWQHAQAQVANMAAQLLSDHEYLFLTMTEADGEFSADMRELRAAVKTMNETQEAFLRAFGSR